MAQLKFVALGSLLGALAGTCLSGCAAGAPDCAAPDHLAGVCVGVPAADVCSTDTCTEGVACAAVVEVGSDAELAPKAAAATAGTCLSLAPGHYGAVALPGGVSLLGRSAAEVAV